jgi:PIN like domain
VRFFFDASFSKRLCHATRILEQGNPEVQIVFKPEKFPARGVADTVWIGALAEERDWVVVTLDYDILRKPHERVAWDEAGLTGFFFDGTWGNLKIDDIAWRFFRWWPVIKATSGAMQPGSTFVVPSRHGRRLVPLKS